MNYDLEERTKRFGKAVIEEISKIKISDLNRNIINQLLRSATSIGANYREVNGASSRKDFSSKIFICRREAQETEYWIELLVTTNIEIKDKLRVLWKEAHELVLIFNRISSTLRKTY